MRPGFARWPRERLLARLYDWEHDRHQHDLWWYRSLARRGGGPALELACGTGRVLAALREETDELIGVDRSTAMLERARRRLGLPALPSPPPPRRIRSAPLHGVPGARERVTLVEADMARYQPPSGLGLVVLALDALGLLGDVRQQIDVLRRIALALRPGGLLAFDVMNVGMAADQPQGVPILQLSEFDDEMEAEVIKWVVRRISPSRQRLDLDCIYDLACEGEVIRRVMDRLTLRYFSRYELELLLDAAHLQAEGFYGDYEGGPFLDQSERIVVVARKRDS